MRKQSEINSHARAEYVAPALECNEFETEQGIASSVTTSGSGINAYSEDSTYGSTSWN